MSAEPSLTTVHRRTIRPSTRVSTQTILRHRNADTIALDTVLPTGKLSVYDFETALPDLVPTEAEAEECIRDVERRYADSTALEREIARWWDV